MKTKFLKLLSIILAFTLCSCGTVQTVSTDVSETKATIPTQTTDAPTEATDAPTEPTTVATEPSATVTEPTEPPEPEPLFPAVEYDDNGYVPKALMYHLVLEEPYNGNVGLFVRPTDLEDQIQKMLDEGYVFLFADEYGKTKEKSVVLTFDDGYTDNYTELLPILKKYNVKATVYLIGDLIGNHHEYLTYDQIREMAESGYVQFGSHTMSHPYLAACSDEEIIKEYTDSIALIEELTGKECRTIAYPYGSYNQRVTAITKQYFDFAYNSGYYPPDDDELNYYISRYYVKRGIDGEGLLGMIR